LGADVADAIPAILNVVADPNSDGQHQQRREQSVAQCPQTCERYGTAKQTASSPMSHSFEDCPMPAFLNCRGGHDHDDERGHGRLREVLDLEPSPDNWKQCHGQGRARRQFKQNPVILKPSLAQYSRSRARFTRRVRNDLRACLSPRFTCGK